MVLIPLRGAHVCVAKTSVSRFLDFSPRLSPPDSLSPKVLLLIWPEWHSLRALCPD